MKEQVLFPIERETEKAVYCRARGSWTFDRYVWIPKSACDIAREGDVRCGRAYAGDYVTAVAPWVLRKLK